jgi:hypothetical protein
MKSPLAPGMRNVDFALISVAPNPLTVLDAQRRLYVGMARDGSYYHVVQPTQIEVRDPDGNVIRPVGALVCGCKGATFHGECYRLRQAEAFEAGQDIDPPAWMGLPPLLGLDNPAGAGESVEASRG